MPTDVILACAAVVKLPDKLVALTLPPVMLPVAEIKPAVRMLPASMLPETLTVAPVCVVALTLAPPKMLPPVMLPVALINPAVNKFAPVTLPLELIAPEFNEVNVPTDVILACAAVVKLPDRLVADTLPPVMLPVAEINPAVRRFPPCMLPATVTKLAV